MTSNCITETSKACLKTFCVNPLLPLPHPPNPETQPSDPRRDFIKSIISAIQPNTTFTNHESLPSLTQLFSNLKNAFPGYLNTILADEIRAREYFHFSLSNHVCLDYNGNGLFSSSQLQDKYNNNPTAVIASSSTTEAHAPFFDISYKSVSLDSYNGQESEFESEMRKRITKYMNLLEDDYILIFTANQTSAMKLLACSYPFGSNPNLLTVYDHENESVQAITESGKSKGTRPLSAVFSWPNLKVNSKKLRKLIVANKSRSKNKGLFIFPLQSRLTGSRYSHQWMNLARDNGWHVLLDACALGAKDMETLGLSLFQPDFIISSFYKIFGENPSGFCCLFIKKSNFSNLNKFSTSTGIISLTPAKGPFKKGVIDETEEHKTLVPEIVELDENQEPSTIKLECHGLDHADTIGLIQISNRSRCLINWLINALLCLKHPNSQTGIPLVIIYGPKIKLDRGPALAFNVYDWKGAKVDPFLVQKLADRYKISLSCGFLKNIWFSKDFHETKEILLENRKGMEKKKKRERDCGIGVVSICIGMLSNFEDMYRVWRFVSRFLDADFVEKERWRYTALNQTSVEV